MKYDSIQMSFLKLVTVLTVVGLSVFIAQRNERKAADSNQNSAKGETVQEFDFARFAELDDRGRYSRNRIQILQPVRLGLDTKEAYLESEADDDVVVED